MRTPENKIILGILIGLVICFGAGYMLGQLHITRYKKEIQLIREQAREIVDLQEYKNQIVDLQKEHSTLENRLENFFLLPAENLPPLVESAQKNLHKLTQCDYVDSDVSLDFHHYEKCNFLNCTIIVEYGVFKLTECFFDDNCRFIVLSGSPAQEILELDQFVREASGTIQERAAKD
jgi:hypothetical protein